MLFNSLHFLVFFLVVTLVYYRLKAQKSRILLLLFASCYFYMSLIPVYILILGGTIVVDYFAGLQIERSEGTTRKTWLVLSIIANIGALAVFKYYNFFLTNIGVFLPHVNPHDLPFLKMALPIGLSFHTFQAMSYTIEVYRKKQVAERNFSVYALYVMFYPQLVAGPIERPQHVLPQLHELRSYDFENVKEGISRMAWGFFKKVVIADRLAIAVDYIHSYASDVSGLSLFVGAVFYSFQIYCDFSGYSDIALGAAKVMNINLRENFDQPYLSRNIVAFWGKWHQSLTSWFRDYLYIPLGGNRQGNNIRVLNVLIVFLISGLWHGANWTFVVWGFLHGFIFILGQREDANKKQSGIVVAFQYFSTFVTVTFLWVFFRSENIHSALQYIVDILFFKPGSNYTGLSKVEMFFSFFLIAGMMVREKLLPFHTVKNDKIFYVYTLSMVAVCYFFGVFAENQFIYFQF